MIEPYNLNNNSNSTNLNFMLNNITEKAFFFVVIVLAIIIIINLLIWLFGAKIKSEKATKLGLRNFIFTSILEVIILLIPVIIAFFK